MDFLQNLLSWENLTVLIAIIGGIWAGFKTLVGKIFKALDEAEDVITQGALVMNDSADVINAVVQAGTPEKDGSIKITAEEWNAIKQKAEAVKKSTVQFQIEIKEAWAAIKTIFKKDKQ